MKVFVSYSRNDVAFADLLVIALENLGFDSIFDWHDIDAAGNRKDGLGELFLSCVSGTPFEGVLSHHASEGNDDGTGRRPG